MRLIVDFSSSNSASLTSSDSSSQFNFETANDEPSYFDQIVVSALTSEIRLTTATTTTTNPWNNLTFSFADLFNIPLGLLEGSMAAIPSNTNNYYCSTNATAARSNIASMDGYFSSLDINDGVV